MDTLNLDYDAEFDVLYASFGPPVAAVSAPLPRGDVLVRVGADGTMVGFTLMGLRRGEMKVPMISGLALRGTELRIPASAPWLHLLLRADGLLEFWVDPAHKLVVRGLAETDGGDPLIVDLTPAIRLRSLALS